MFLPIVKPTWIVIGILSLALGVAAWAAKSQYDRAEGLETKVEQLTAQTKVLTDQLTSKDGVIEQFEVAAKEAQEIIHDQKLSIDKAASRVRALRVELAETRTKLQQLEEADYAITECAALLATDLSVCPGHSSGLRERAYGGFQGPGGDSSPADTNPDRLTPDH